MDPNYNRQFFAFYKLSRGKNQRNYQNRGAKVYQVKRREEAKQEPSFSEDLPYQQDQEVRKDRYNRLNPNHNNLQKPYQQQNQNDRPYRNKIQQHQSFQRKDKEKEDKSYFSFNTLESMSEMSFEDLISSLLKSKNLSTTINNTNFSLSIYSQFIKILDKIIMTQDDTLDELQNKILISFIDSEFFSTLEKKYFQEIHLKTTKLEDYVQRIQDLEIMIQIFEKFMNMFRSRINIIPIPQLYTFITSELEVLAEKCDPIGYNKKQLENLNTKVKDLNKKKLTLSVNEGKEKNKEEEKNFIPQRSNPLEESYKLRPPSNFLNIPTIPTKEELYQAKPFLRAMPIQGQFRNTEDYLDCVYRLLREDAIQPLRKGIQLLVQRQGQLTVDREFKNLIKQSGVRLFMNAVVHDLDISDYQGEVTVTLRITDKNLNTNWIQSKKLLSGSLIVLSPNNFRDIFIGIVRERDGEKMSRTAQRYKYVDIQIELILDDEDFDISSIEDDQQSSSDEESKSSYQKKKMMESNYKNPLIQFFLQNKGVTMSLIESTAYFEAYQHVLNKLKEMGQWLRLPFEEYFTAQKTNQILQPLYYEKEMNVNAQLAAKIRQNLAKANLDQSQKLALKQCLEKELAIIQGPPGTGKTYIGDVFTSILLENKKLWKQKGPILLVCYTNHALDQFLMHIRKYTDNFLRIGGRCNNPELKQNTLNEYCKFNKIQFSRRFFQVKDKIRELTNDFYQKKDESISQIYKIINSTIQESDIQYHVKQIKNQFKKYLEHCIYGSYYKRNFQDQMYDYILTLVGNESDLIIIFWLEIIDLDKMVNLYSREMKKDKNFLNYEYEYLNLEDVDERFLDNEKEFQEYQQNQYTLEQKIWFYNCIFKIALSSTYYHNCKNVEECIQFGNTLPIQQNLSYQDNLSYFKLRLRDKWILNNSLMSTVKIKHKKSLDLITLKLKQLFQEKKQLLTLRDREALKTADLVAMTTTGCAKFSELVRNITFPVVIVEEAAEVFEAHILTSLSKKTEHLILIGDHQQLKPNPAVYDLDINYNLSMSLFERMIKNKFDYVTLTNQRRMRPEISSIIKLIYPKLQDSPQVMNYPDIRGISSNLFFLDHQNKEEENKGLSSKQNDYEAQMIVRYVFYLIQQRYKPEQITVLSLYQAQSLHIKKTLVNLYKKDSAARVKVITVDNYQGEENDIIILSLVRSNAQNNIGFLKITNRICVALSRAKHGMFIFGNASCLINAKNQDGDLWKQVLNYLKEKEFIGQSLNLQCNNHQIVTEVKTPVDFQKVPEGGCKKKCQVRILCGHSCESFCHYYQKTNNDPDGHQHYKCLKKCLREKPCKHECTYGCYECKNGCLPCKELVPKKFDKCGHINQVQCGKFNQEVCKSTCETIFKCGHQCQGLCYEDCFRKPCKQYVDGKLPCGHIIDKECYLTMDEFINKSVCYKQCKKVLKCGHQCPSKCGECNRDYFHGECKYKCEKKLICGHICKSECKLQCPGCDQKCEIECGHSKCDKKCKEVCTKCIEECQNKCQHSQCTRLCYEPCNKKLCNEPCDKILSCNHPCMGLCGERCPQICRQCKPEDDAFQIFFGTEDDLDAKFIELDCGHSFEVQSLDYYMSSSVAGEVQFKKCPNPNCQRPIKKTFRYQNIINQVLEDISQIKQRSEEEEKSIANQYKDLKQELNNLKSFLNDMESSYSKNILQLISENENNYNKILSTDFEAIQQFHKKLQLLRCQISYASFLSRPDESILIKLGSKRNQVTTKVDGAFNYLNKSKLYLSQEQFERALRLAKLVDSTYDFNKIKDMIFKAVGLSAGHYYKCSNGHIYVIGDCGGAMEESKCPDCGVKIGGSNHQLLQGNQHASEMGGSRPAWDPDGFDARVLRGEIDLRQFAQ